MTLEELLADELHTSAVALWFAVVLTVMVQPDEYEKLDTAP